MPLKLVAKNEQDINVGKRSAGSKIKQGGRRKKKISLLRQWTDLSHQLTVNILRRLGAIEILLTAQMVCKTWHFVCQDPAMWRVIDMQNDNYKYKLNSLYDLNEIFRRAVDRSQGQLVDIYLEFIATNELLDYIAKRCVNLKLLGLFFCHNISDEGLIEAIKRFPKLEFFIIFRTPIFKETIEIVGNSCPMLTSFKWGRSGIQSRPSFDCDDEEAFVIARTMPELRHLQLERIFLTKVGLKAIMVGCPRLETLDLRCCPNLDLKGI